MVPEASRPLATRASALASRLGIAPIPCAWLLFYALWAVLFMFLHFAMTHEYPVATFDKLAEFRAETPFQYRVLFPLLGAGVRAVAGKSVGLGALYRLLDVAECFAVLVAFRELLRATTAIKTLNPAALVVLYPMFWNYCVYGRLLYAWDVPAILFFVLGLLALARRSWLAFYVVFVLGVFNRETICFLTLAYVVTAWGREKLPAIAGHAALQLVIWLGAKVLLTRLFAGNPGELFGMLLQRNLTALTSVNFDTVRTALAFGLIWLFIPLAWTRLPAFHRRLLWVVPPFLAGMTVVGILSELRIYSELVPILALPAAIALFENDASSALPSASR